MGSVCSWHNSEGRQNISLFTDSQSKIGVCVFGGRVRVPFAAYCNQVGNVTVTTAQRFLFRLNNVYRKNLPSQWRAPRISWP